MDEQILELINRARTQAQEAKSQVFGFAGRPAMAVNTLSDSVLALCHALERTNRKVADIDGGRPKT